MMEKMGVRTVVGLVRPTEKDLFAAGAGKQFIWPKGQLDK